MTGAGRQRLGRTGAGPRLPLLIGNHHGPGESVKAVAGFAGGAGGASLDRPTRAVVLHIQGRQGWAWRP
jgi:hypothetical protein